MRIGGGQQGYEDSSADGQFSNPKSVTLDPAGNIYVVEINNHRIQKFDPSGNFLMKFGSAGSGNGQFSQPRGVVLDSAGNIYVADYNNNRIQKFDPAGTFLATWGTLGTGDGQFNKPSSIAIDSHNILYVTDSLNHRVQAFNTSGEYLSQFGSTGTGDGQFNTPGGIFIDPADNIYLADTNNHRIQVFSTTGQYMTQFGSTGTGEGQFNQPSGITISDGTIYVSDTGNNRIQTFDFAQTVSLQTSPSGGAEAAAVDLAASTGATVSCASTIAADDLPEDTGNPTGYPLGLVDFCLSTAIGATHTVTLSFATDLAPETLIARKYNPTTQTYATIQGATITSTTISGQPGVAVTYQLTDGGALDADGAANGEILDPMGLAIAPPASQSGWAGITLASALASTGMSLQLLLVVALGGIGGGIVVLRRRID